jgi:acetyl-CoA synthetase
MDRRTLRTTGTWDDHAQGFVWRVPDRFNIAVACCDSWAAAEPGREAIRHIRSDGTVEGWSYGRLKEASDRFANALAARGVGRGDRVAVLLPQGPEVLVTHFAVQKLGAVVLPLFTLFGPDALAFRLADSGAKAIVTNPENLGKVQDLRDACPDLGQIYVTGRARDGVRGLDDDIAAASPHLTPVATRADDPATLIYTSGTTGAPKGALHAHRFLIGHLPCVELHHELFPRPGDVGWTPADWAWIGGLMDLALPCLYFGVPLVSHRARKFDPDAAFALIRDQGIRSMFLPPTALKLMRQTTVPEGVNVRSIGSGGESLGADLLDWGMSALGAPINELYGQTECNLVVTSSRGAGCLRPGTMGRAVPGHDVAILDADGQPLPPGATGEIAVRRPDPVMFLGYWNQSEKTAAKFTGDWMRTGDLGMADEEGYITYVSRDDDIITSAGYRIGPTEIENCLTGDPDVVMAAAVGVPDPVRTEIVKAFVVLRDGAATDGLTERLVQRVKERVSLHVAPRAIEFVTDLPMTATGKIMRRELRARG